MSTTGWLLLAAPTPEPTPIDPGFTIYTVTPGISGFLAFFAIAIAGWLLFRSMGRRMRNVDNARRQREIAEAEERDQAAATDDAPPAEAGPADGDAAAETTGDAVSGSPQ